MGTIQQRAGISAITIENFKAIRKEQKICFRPITLLFGPNSAGKSTILQALQFMREVLERRNVDTDRTIAGGDSVDLGGFRNLAAHHDMTQPVSVRIDFTLGADELPRYGGIRVDEATDTDLRKDLAENGLGDVETAWIKVISRWQESTRRAWITNYEVGLNGQRIAEISTEPGFSPCITLVDFDHPLFMRFDEAEEIEPEDDQGTRKRMEALYRGLFLFADSASPMEGIELIESRHAGVIPNFAEPLPLASDTIDEEDIPVFEVFSFIVNQILVGTGDLLLRHLKSLRYLGPLRQVPPRNYLPQSSPDEARWANGLAAWDILYSHYDHKSHTGDDFFKAVSRIMIDEDGLDLGYSMELVEVYEIRDESVIMNHLRMLETGSEADAGELFRGPLVNELKRLQPQRRLLLHDEVNDTDVKPQDIGVGISQVIPVIVGAVEPKCSVFVVEQPELHVHPRIQCDLGDVFAQEANKDDDRIFLIETHSEHLILRLLRRIRETTENELPPGKPELRPDQLAVYYIEGGEDGMEVTHIPVTEDGDFADKWPEGFFPERVEELM